jgi:hypothetical protein
MPAVEPLARPARMPDLKQPPPVELSGPVQMPRVEPLASAATPQRPALPARQVPPSRPEPPQRTLGAAEPSRQEVSALPVRGNDSRNLLALSPVPAQREQQVAVPTGEARGRFAISPDPNLAAAGIEPGSKPGTPPAATQAKDAAVTIPAQPPGNGGTAGAGPEKTIAAKDKEPAGNRTGTDRAPLTIVGGASGPGNAPGSSSGSGKSAFSGITIIGGASNTAAPANAGADTPNTVSPPRAPRALQTAYDLTVVTTENSGGGLPYYGVFAQRQVYTVYLDMRQTEDDPAPQWTLEFAALDGASGRPRAAGNAGETQPGLILPFPAVKERPVLPPEAARRHLRKMMIVYGIVNLEGKLEQLSVKDSPDSALNEPVLAALRKWVFRPARLDGEPVPAMVLFGIPLWLHD